MLLRRISARKYWGIAVIAVSAFLLFTTFSLPLLGNLAYLNTHQNVVAIGCYGALIVGSYLVAGPVGILVALVPAVASGCFGGGGGGGGPKPEPDLGEPPEPPGE